MGMDRDSDKGDIAVRCDDRTLPARLQLTIDRRVLDLRAAPVEGIDADFRGQSLPKDQSLPGPLQGLVAGDNTVKLEAGRPATPQPM